MAVSRIVGPDGKPIQVKSLSAQVAAAQLVGIRKAWRNAFIGNLTPEKLASILKAVNSGDADSMLDLAEEMRERDPHYASVLGTRIRAVTGRPIIVESYSDESLYVDQADLIREIVGEPGFVDLMADLLDALNSPFSVSEIGWDTTTPPWIPRDRWEGDTYIPAYGHKDPRWFQYDPVTGRELRLKEHGNRDGVRLPAYKFIVHHAGIKSGLPIRGGLARLCALGYCAKNFTLEDWLTFAEIYGIPMRIGRYGPSADQDQIDTLTDAILGLGSDAAAVISESMQIEFQSAATGNADIFEKLANWVDKQISKAVLGQTSTADAVAGQLGKQDEKEEVRLDILRDDSRKLTDTLRRDLILPVLKLNFPTVDHLPQVRIAAEKAEDLTLLASALEKLVPLGLRVEQSVVRDKFGIPDPAPDAELLAAPATPVATHPDPDTPNEESAMNRLLLALALNRVGDVDGLLSEIEARELANWRPVMKPLIDPVLQLRDQAQTFDEFMSGIAGLREQMDGTELIRRLARGMFEASGIGNARP